MFSNMYRLSMFRVSAVAHTLKHVVHTRFYHVVGRDLRWLVCFSYGLLRWTCKAKKMHASAGAKGGAATIQSWKQSGGVWIKHLKEYMQQAATIYKNSTRRQTRGRVTRFQVDSRDALAMLGELLIIGRLATCGKSPVCEAFPYMRSLPVIAPHPP